MSHRSCVLACTLAWSACGGSGAVTPDGATSPCTTCGDDLGTTASDAASAGDAAQVGGSNDAAMKAGTDAAVSQPGACAQDSASYTTSGDYDYKNYGNYNVSNDNWGGAPNQKLFANSADCWGVTTTATTEVDGIRSYPNGSRGWINNDTIMTALSTKGTSDWTTKSGMGIQVGKLTKAKAHWAFSAPTTGSRWDALADIYFHATATPAPNEFPPLIDLQLIQADQDQVINNTTYYASVATSDHASTVTVSGVQYVVYIDDPGGAGFHSAGGHTITVLVGPGPFTRKDNNPIWGTQNGVNDVAALIKFFNQANPVDDNKKPLVDASNKTITSPLIPSSVYLTAINAGFEIDFGEKFTNSALCIAMQDEPDCP